MSDSDILDFADLRTYLGKQRFRTLADDLNRSLVKEFADWLLNIELPDSIVLPDGTYEVVSFLREGEESIDGELVLQRARELGANIGATDGEYLLRHQASIPAVFRKRVTFICTSWWSSREWGEVWFIMWDDISNRWEKRRSVMHGHSYSSNMRLLRYTKNRLLEG